MSTHYCRHIKTNGRRCCSLAMRGQSFCFFHRALNAHHRTLHRLPDTTPTILHPTRPDIDGLQRNPLVVEQVQQPAPIVLNFPPLEDRQAIQVALSMVATALGQNRIDSRRAAGLVYALQVASTNAQKLETIPEFPTYESELDADGTEIALDVDPREVLESDEDFPDYEDDDNDREEPSVKPEPRGTSAKEQAALDEVTSIIRSIQKADRAAGIEPEPALAHAYQLTTEKLATRN